MLVMLAADASWHMAAMSQVGKLAGAIKMRILSDNLTQIEMAWFSGKTLSNKSWTSSIKQCLSAWDWIAPFGTCPDWSTSHVHCHQVHHSCRRICKWGTLHSLFAWILACILVCDQSPEYLVWEDRDNLQYKDLNSRWLASGSTWSRTVVAKSWL